MPLDSHADHMGTGTEAPTGTELYVMVRDEYRGI